MEDLEAAANSYMSSWMELATTPFGSPLDSAKMFWPVAPPRKSHFKAAAKMRAVKLENESCKIIGMDSGKETIPQERNGDASASTVKIIVGADGEMSVTNTRVITASALGIFASKLREGSFPYVTDALWNALASLSGVQRQVDLRSLSRFLSLSHLPLSLSLSIIILLYQVASMVLISWFKEIKSNDLSEKHGVLPVFPNHIKSWLLDLLSGTDPTFPTKDSVLPYSELSRTYAKMRSEASQLLHAIESSGMFENILSSIKVDVESLSTDKAINLASKLPPLCNDSTGNESIGRNIVDDIESSKHRLLTTASYLKCVQVGIVLSCGMWH